jgi:hypothetical protein
MNRKDENKRETNRQLFLSLFDRVTKEPEKPPLVFPDKTCANCEVERMNDVRQLRCCIPF